MQPPGGAARVPVSVTSMGGAGGELAQATMLLRNLVSPMRQNSSSSGNSQLGPCFMCGKLGHFRSCPLLQGAGPPKNS